MTRRFVGSLFVLGLAAGYFVMARLQEARVPDAGEWARASEEVRSRWRPDDWVLFSPAWAHAGAPWLAGLPMDIAERTDWYEASKHPRVFVIASYPERDPVPPESWRVLETIPLDRVTVHLWAPPEQSVLVWDARRHLPDARVSRGQGAGQVPCDTFQDQRWHCGAPHPWQNVGLIDRDIAGRVREVIWAHARDRGEPLEVAWRDLPQARRLTVHWGLTQRAVEQDTGSPVVAEVLLGDRVVVHQVLDIHEAGWFRHDLPLEAGGSPSFRVRVTAQKNQDRQFCFTADLWQ